MADVGAIIATLLGCLPFVLADDDDDYKCYYYSYHTGYRYYYDTCYGGCCGYRTNPHCCEDWTVGAIIGIVIGGVIALILLVSFIVAIICCCKKSGTKGRVVHPTSGARIHTTTAQPMNTMVYTTAYGYPGPSQYPAGGVVPPPAYGTVSSAPPPYPDGDPAHPPQYVPPPGANEKS